MLCNFLMQTLQYLKRRKKNARENMKKRPQKLLIIGPFFFQFCQPAQNQPKFQFLFHKKLLTTQLMYNDFA